MSPIPIDGRPVKSPWKQVKQATPTKITRGTKLIEPTRAKIPSGENLQPAPIPPKNPWNRRRIVPSDDENFPPLPRDQKLPIRNGEHPFPRTTAFSSGAASEEASSTSRPCSSCSSSTRPRSSTVAGLVSTTPCCSRRSLKALEAAAPRATEKLAYPGTIPR